MSCITFTRRVSIAIVAGFLAGCASVAPPSPASSAARAAEAALAAEQRWLGQLFAGTPVRIELQRDGQLAVAVPLDFSFDSGRSTVKPPLAKVLDYVAQSARRQSTVRVHVAAPTDARGTPALALRRAGAVRAYLGGKGVTAQRFAELGAADGDSVRLRLEPAPQ